MAEIYLLPENVPPSDATMVLAFLNAATSAEEIATAVELPDELDIGLRIAARILARRDQLGEFTSLQQVYAVPYVGPERFTELVTSLSTARPPPAFDDLIDRTLLTQINQRLNMLEGRVNASETIRLQAINPDVLLGQETILIAELKDGNGNPLINRELTVVTTWGLLSGRAGLYPVNGNSITVRSDHLGLCRLRLSAVLGEALTSVETASLSQALTLLSAANTAPRDNMQALTELARLYRAPGNDSLRRAIDVYFKRYGNSAQLNAPVDSLNSWPHIAVTVVAWLTPTSDLATAQLPTTILNIQQRNWFYAWLWAYRQLLEDESSLVASLAAVDSNQRSGSGILTDLFSRIGSFVGAQDGLVGQQLGQSFAANSLNVFLQSGLSNVPFEERTKVITGVTSGVKSLSKTVPFSTLKSSRAETNLQIDSRVASVDSSTQFEALDSRLSLVESSALTTADIAGLRSDILAAADQATAVRIDQLQGQLQIDFNEQLSNKADTAVISQLENRFNESLDSKADATDISRLEERFNDRLNNKADSSAIGQLEGRLNDRLDSKADASAIGQLENRFNDRLNSKADVTILGALNQQVLALSDQTRSLDSNLSTITTGINRRIDNLDTSGRRRP